MGIIDSKEEALRVAEDLRDYITNNEKAIESLDRLIRLIQKLENKAY